MTFDGTILSLNATSNAELKIASGGHNAQNGGILANSQTMTIGDTQDSDAFNNVIIKAIGEKAHFAEDETKFSGAEVQFGENDTGIDVTFFGATSGRKAVWDESQDHMKFYDNTRLAFGSGAATAGYDTSLMFDASKLQLSGTAGFALAATNKLYFDGGSNTYMHESSADSLDFVVGGVTLLEINEQGGQYDYGQLNAPLFIISDDSSGTTSPPTLRLQNTHTTLTSNDVIGRIDVKASGDDHTSANDGIVSRIETISIGHMGGGGLTDDTPVAMIFKVGDNDTGDLVESMRLIWTTASEYVGLFAGPVRTTNGTSAAPAYQFGSVDDGFFHQTSSPGAGIKVMVNGANEALFADGGDFHSDGDVIAFSTTISDERLKDDVVTIESPIDKIKRLRGVEYVWNTGKRKGQKDLGVIAQEVEKVIPEIVKEKIMPFIDDTDTNYKTVDYEKLSAVLIEGMKEQQKQIDELRREVEELK